MAVAVPVAELVVPGPATWRPLVSARARLIACPECAQVLAVIDFLVTGDGEIGCPECGAVLQVHDALETAPKLSSAERPGRHSRIGTPTRVGMTAHAELTCPGEPPPIRYRKPAKGPST